MKQSIYCDKCTETNVRRVWLAGQFLIQIFYLKVHKREKFFGSDFEFFTIL